MERDGRQWNVTSPRDITCYGTMMGRFPRLTPVRLGHQVPDTYDGFTVSVDIPSPNILVASTIAACVLWYENLSSYLAPVLLIDHGLRLNRHLSLPQVRNNMFDVMWMSLKQIKSPHPHGKRWDHSNEFSKSSDFQGRHVPSSLVWTPREFR